MLPIPVCLRVAGVAPGVLAGMWQFTDWGQGSSGTGGSGQATSAASGRSQAQEQTGRGRGFFLPWRRGNKSEMDAHECEAAAVKEDDGVVVPRLGAEDEEDDVRCGGSLWCTATRIDAAAGSSEGASGTAPGESATSNSGPIVADAPALPGLRPLASHCIGGESSLASTPRGTRSTCASTHGCMQHGGCDQDHTVHYEVPSPRSLPLKVYASEQPSPAITRLSCSSPMHALHSTPMSKARIMRALYQSLAASKDAGGFAAALQGTAVAPA